jgi:hypothetical protein
MIIAQFIHTLRYIKDFVSNSKFKMLKLTVTLREFISTNFRENGIPQEITDSLKISDTPFSIRDYSDFLMDYIQIWIQREFEE